jgi:hypothetical protein
VYAAWLCACVALGSRGAFLFAASATANAQTPPPSHTHLQHFKTRNLIKTTITPKTNLGDTNQNQNQKIETMHDATCARIREVAEAHKLPLPDALRPTSIPGPKHMYHVNMSGARW